MRKQIRLLFLLFTFFAFTQCSSPENKVNTEELKTLFSNDFEKYFSFLNTKNWEEVIEMTNPNLFRITSKESLVDFFKQMNLMGIELTINQPKLIQFTDLIEYKNVFYTKIKYHATTIMSLSDNLVSLHGQIEKELYKSYPIEAVTYNKEENEFEIDTDSFIVATSFDNKKTWTYFELNKSKEEILKQIIPPIVYTKIIEQ